MPVAKKAAGPVKKTGARRAAAPKDDETQSSPVSANSMVVSNVDPVFVRDRAVQLALNLPYVDDDGNANATAAKVITQAKRFEDYLLGSGDDA